MKIWTIANQKGGVGKTTTTVTLGGILAQKNQRVLLIDTDPHASLSYYFGVDSEALTKSTYDIFVHTGAIDKELVLDCLCPTKFDTLFVLPATMNLATLDRKLGSRGGMGLVLTKALKAVESEFDYVLIDCPPVLGVLMVNALAACERIIVPVQTEFLALKGLDRMMHTLDIMSQSLKKTFDALIVPTMFDKRVNAALEAYQTLKEDYGDLTWKYTVPVDTRFREASQAQTPISMFAPRSRGAYAYTKLLIELEST